MMKKKNILALIISLGLFANLAIGDDVNSAKNILESILGPSSKNSQNDDEKPVDTKKSNPFIENDNQSKEVFDPFAGFDPWDN